MLHTYMHTYIHTYTHTYADSVEVVEGDVEQLLWVDAVDQLILQCHNHQVIKLQEEQ